MTRVATPLRFLVYGVVGSLAESAFSSGVDSADAGRLVIRGPSTPWMLALYGLALPLFEPVHDAVRGRPVWQRGLVYAGGIIAVEAISGLLWRRITGVVPWEYRSGLALGGVTRLDYAPAWALVGLTAEGLHDFMTARPESAGGPRDEPVAGRGARATLRAG